MIKKKYILPIFALFLATYFWKEKQNNVLNSSSQESKIATQTKQQAQNIQGAVASTMPLQERSPASIKPVNHVSDMWEKDLKNSLVIQGGSFIKDIQITKERSFTFTKDKTPLHAHSVKIDLKNQNDESSSFRAIIDASTGKILETFDRTQFDQIGHNHRPTKFKAEPFYQ